MDNEKTEGKTDPFNSLPLNSEPSEAGVESNENGAVGGGEETIVETASPVSQTMVSALDLEKAEAEKKKEAEKKQKSKRGVIIGVIIGLVVLLAGGFGLAFALGAFKGADPVASAISKAFGGSMPENIGLDGSIILIPKDNPVFSKVKLNLKMSSQTASLTNSAKADLTVSLSSHGDINLSASELYVEGSDLYLKLEGLKAFYEQYGSMLEAMVGARQTTNTTNCISDADDDSEAVTNCMSLEEMTTAETEPIPVDCIGEETDCLAPASSETSSITAYLQYLGDIVEMVDGEWVRIPLDEITDLAGQATITGQSSCALDLMNNARKNRSVIAEMYGRNSFVGSSEDKVSIEKKNDPIYKVAFDAGKMANFINDLSGASFITDYYTCNDVEPQSASVGKQQISNLLTYVPDIYLEINGDSDITRFYTELDTEQVSVVIDLSFSYPKTINVSEPTSHKELKEIIMTLFTKYMTDAQE